MMNKIYNFNEIEEIRTRKKKLVFEYLLCVLIFLVALILIYTTVKNNILLAIVFFVLLSFFILFSIVFWKIKYGILKARELFLDNMESGRREDYVGIFEESIAAENDEEFCVYVFSSTNKKTDLLIHKHNRTCFEKGKKYHLECIGDYVFGWEIIE